MSWKQMEDFRQSHQTYYTFLDSLVMPGMPTGSLLQLAHDLAQAFGFLSTTF